MTERGMMSRLVAQMAGLSTVLSVITAYIASHETQKGLDSEPGVDVIIFTGGFADDPATRPTSKAPDASPSWNTQSASG